MQQQNECSRLRLLMIWMNSQSKQQLETSCQQQVTVTYHLLLRRAARWWLEPYCWLPMQEHLLVFRPHLCAVCDAAYCYRCRTFCVCLCFGHTVGVCKNGEPIEIPFGEQTCVGPMNCVRWGCVLANTMEWSVRRRRGDCCYRFTVATCVYVLSNVASYQAVWIGHNVSVHMLLGIIRHQLLVVAVGCNLRRCSDRCLPQCIYVCYPETFSDWSELWRRAGPQEVFYAKASFLQYWACWSCVFPCY